MSTERTLSTKGDGVWVMTYDGASFTCSQDGYLDVQNQCGLNIFDVAEAGIRYLRRFDSEPFSVCAKINYDADRVSIEVNKV